MDSFKNVTGDGNEERIGLSLSLRANEMVGAVIS